MQRLRMPLIASVGIVFIGIFVTGWLDLYVRWPILDKVLHGIGGFLAAWLVWAVLHNALGTLTAWQRSIIVISGACLLGVLWEFAEFASTVMRSWSPVLYHYFHGGDLADTLSDIAVDIGGAFVFTLLTLRRRAKSAPVA